MKVSISDPGALARIQPDALERYLAARGWDKLRDLTMATIWTKRRADDQLADVTVPRRDAADFVLRVSEALRTVADLEGRSQLDVYRALVSRKLGLRSLIPVLIAAVAASLGAYLFHVLWGAPTALLPKPVESPVPFQPLAGAAMDAWVMVATALSLFAAVAGIATYYAGRLPRQFALSLAAQVLGAGSVATVVWCVVGYSLVFTSTGSVYGDLSMAFLRGVDQSRRTGTTVSENVFAMYSMTFATMSVVLLNIAALGRVKTTSLLLFLPPWLILVFCPIAHMLWGAGGWMNGLDNPNAGVNAVDLAGGAVVHTTSGWSALALAIILGRRKDREAQPIPSSSPALAGVGTAVLWVGWFGFAIAQMIYSNAFAGTAFQAIILAPLMSAATWAGLEYYERRVPSVAGVCSGVLTGLVAISAGLGVVGLFGSIFTSVTAAIVVYAASTRLKAYLRYDDGPDVFAIHGVGGFWGLVSAGLFATVPGSSTVSRGWGLVASQAAAGLVTIFVSVIGTVAIVFAIKWMNGLTPDPETETGTAPIEVGRDDIAYG